MWSRAGAAEHERRCPVAPSGGDRVAGLFLGPPALYMHVLRPIVVLYTYGAGIGRGARCPVVCLLPWLSPLPLADLGNQLL